MLYTVILSLHHYVGFLQIQTKLVVPVTKYSNRTVDSGDGIIGSLVNRDLMFLLVYSCICIL